VQRWNALDALTGSVDIPAAASATEASSCKPIRAFVVVNHYDDFLHLGLSGEQKRDLVEYLKSI
jgi:hypothetical protein